MIGTNSVLDATGGSIYIPYSPLTSGVLGDSVGGGKFAGLQAEDITLKSGVTVGGSVTFKLVFDLSGEFGPLEVLDRATAGVVLNLYDIDFKPMMWGSGLKTESWETMQISFLRDATDSGHNGPSVTLDANTYGAYRDDGLIDGPTDKVTVRYELFFLDDLGLSQEDFDNIDADMEFALYVTLSCFNKRHGGSSVTIRNTPELLGHSFEFNKIILPEPATMALLAGGALALLRRRRA